MCRSFKNGKHIFQGRNLFVVDQNIRSIHFALHFLGIRNEVRRNISSVELHTFYNIDSRIGTFGLFYRDNTFFLHFLHSLGNELTNLAIVIGRDTSNRFDFLKIVAHFLSLSLDTFYHFGYGFVDASLQIHGLAPAATFLSPTFTMACANTVAVVVPSPASSPVLEATSFTN